MNYFLALICPPLSVFLSGGRKLVILSLCLSLVAIWALYAANAGLFMGGYALGPVVYVLAIIQAFVMAHRFYQRQTGQRHPHRGTNTQSKL